MSDPPVLNRCKEWRLRAGISQLQVAARAGVSVETVRRLESDTLVRVRFGTLVRIAHSWGVSVVDLVPAAGAAPSKPYRAPL